MDRLKSLLIKHQRVGLDTSILIYHLESNPLYLPMTTELLGMIRDGEFAAVTSTITLMEINIRPLQLGRADVADEYELLISRFPNLYVYDVSIAIARIAAELRAKYRLRPADALQVGTALHFEATLFVSNDDRLRAAADEIPMLMLKDFLPA